MTLLARGVVPESEMGCLPVGSRSQIITKPSMPSLYCAVGMLFANQISYVALNWVVDPLYRNVDVALVIAEICTGRLSVVDVRLAERAERLRLVGFDDPVRSFPADGEPEGDGDN